MLDANKHDNTVVEEHNLQSERKQQPLKHKCLREEYEDHFWQFSAHQLGICK